MAKYTITSVKSDITYKVSIHYLFNSDNKYNLQTYNNSREDLYKLAVKAKDNYMNKLANDDNKNFYINEINSNEYSYTIEIIFFEKCLLTKINGSDTYPFAEFIQELFTTNDNIFIEYIAYKYTNTHEEYIIFDSVHDKKETIENKINSL